MQGNQYTFEVVRDVATLIDRLAPGDMLTIAVRRDKQSALLEWDSNAGTVCGWSETSNAMEKAYYVKNKFHPDNARLDRTGTAGEEVGHGQ